MSSRQDQEREKKLEPLRLDYAFNKLKNLGFDPYHDGKKITFYYNSGIVTLFPYSGWHTGKTIKDGRGIDNLLKQLK